MFKNIINERLYLNPIEDLGFLDYLIFNIKLVLFFITATILILVNFIDNNLSQLSINFSIVKNLPIIFICENNKYSVYSNLGVRQPKNRKIHNNSKVTLYDNINLTDNVRLSFRISSYLPYLIRIPPCYSLSFWPVSEAKKVLNPILDTEI